MSERPWCVEHDRSAEFTAVFPTEHTVCFSGLGNAETECRIETATVTIKRDAKSEVT